MDFSPCNNFSPLPIPGRFRDAFWSPASRAAPGMGLYRRCSRFLQAHSQADRLRRNVLSLDTRAKAQSFIKSFDFLVFPTTRKNHLARFEPGPRMGRWQELGVKGTPRRLPAG